MTKSDFNAEQRQLRQAWKEYFRDKPLPQNDAEERKQLEEFNGWYNKKHSTTWEFEFEEDYAEPDDLIEDALSLMDKRKYSKAIPLLQKVLNIIPEDEEALSLIIEAHVALGQSKEAQEYSARLMDINPENPEFLLSIVHQHILKEEYDAALKKVDVVLKMAPDWFDPVIMKAQLHYWLGKEYQSLIDIARRIDKKRTDNFMKKFWIEEIPPCHPLAQLNDTLEKVNEFMLKERFEEALYLLRAVKEESLEPQIKEMVKGMKVECLLVLKRTEEAKQLIRRLLQENPENPHAHLYKAQVELNEGNPESALKTIDECIKYAEKRNIPHFDYYSLKAQVLKKLGKDHTMWEEKGKAVQAQNLKLLKKEMKNAGMKYEEKDGFIKLK
ncbi:tetratricopeptide repeat protein [Candidatus Woesearchaeota archaeon]|nr:tetratricopeptide repeat protein [Candidatus Woesearchaeota archaeon]